LRVFAYNVIALFMVLDDTLLRTAISIYLRLFVIFYILPITVVSFHHLWQCAF